MNTGYQKIKSVNDELTLFLFQEDALIYSSRTSKLHLLNALGIYIWLQLEEGFSQQQVIELCHHNGGFNKQASNNQALAALVVELDQLMKNAKIPDSHQAAEQKEEQKEQLWLNEIKLQNFSEADVVVTQVYRILDVDFYFSFPDSKIEKIFTPILNQFECQIENSENIADQEKHKKISIKIIADKNATYRLMINQYLFSWEISAQRLLSFVLDRLRKVAFHFSNHHSGVHAAVLSKGEVCMLMPAKSYSGKSTLSAALVAKGYQYLSDEMAVIDENFNARPVPLGLGLKIGSWEIIKNYMPQIEHTEAMERWDGVAIKYLPIKYLPASDKHADGSALKGMELSLERKKITHLVIPSYQQGSPAKLTKLTIPQALYELFQAGFTQDKDMTAKSVEDLIHQLTTRPCYHFAFDNLEQAVNALDALQ